MASLDLSRLSLPDAVAALRSYPRRLRSALAPTDDPEHEDLAEQIGPDGHSALDHVVALANTLVVLGEALRQVRAGGEPVVHPAVTDPAQREWATPPDTSLAGALDRLAEEAGALADAADRLEPTDAKRAAAVAGGGEVRAIDIVKQAVAAGADHLRAATAAVEAARARRG